MLTNLPRASVEQMSQNINLYYCRKYILYYIIYYIIFLIHIFVKVSIAANLSNGPSIHVKFCSMKVEEAVI